MTNIPGYLVLGWIPGPFELVILLVIVLVLFGPGKLPQVGKGLGSFLANFKREIKSIEEDDSEANLPAKRPESPRREADQNYRQEDDDRKER
jgi:sec-independent protein translocase protein TatA